VELQLSSTSSYVNLLDLDWNVPLGRWNDPRLVRMARGPSRHLVRFVEMDGRVYALKEIDDHLARKEYQMLREMATAELPVVEPIGTVTRRGEKDGDSMPGILITRYLDFALPYSYLLARDSSVDRQRRLLDAAAVLLVQLHLDGFMWGDCSLANILFRRDAGGLRAYLVDSETAERHPTLTPRQREGDLGIALDNFIGGMEDLIAAGRVGSFTDSVAFADRLEKRYYVLWSELTTEEEFPTDEPWRLEERIRRLNEMGFDANEMKVVSVADGEKIRIRPTIVEEGHHHRKLLRLTGIDVQENQARRLLNDMASYRTSLEREWKRSVPEAVAAYHWLTDRFEPFLSAIPPELSARLEPAEAFHQYLEHRWFLSEEAGHSVPEDVAMHSFVENVLAAKPEERLVLPDLTGELDIHALEEVDDPSDPAYSEEVRRTGPSGSWGGLRSRSGTGSLRDSADLLNRAKPASRLRSPEPAPAAADPPAAPSVPASPPAPPAAPASAEAEAENT
jgi:Domain of unknown function (DUF4032)/Lipopolysaccharide kinase (Kdo/WaaP) family